MVILILEIALDRYLENAKINLANIIGISSMMYIFHEWYGLFLSWVFHS